MKNVSDQLLNMLPHVNLTSFINNTRSLQTRTLTEKSSVVATCKYLIDFARSKGFNIAIDNNQVYIYNGAFWEIMSNPEVQSFLIKAAIKMGQDEYYVSHFKYSDALFKQFMVTGLMDNTEFSVSDQVLINLQNGTLNIATDGNLILKRFSANDFLKYQLPFIYDPNSQAPLFQKFLARVLPDLTSQLLLSEFLGYIFLKNGNLKLEKVLMLYGSGENGKSVVFDIVSALLGTENIGTTSLSDLMKKSGGAQYRVDLGNKLLNYSSECGNQLDSEMFKKLASGEPIDARPLYGQPFMLTQYAKLMINANQLPIAPEISHAYFRRLAILRFNVTISKEEKDPELANKIIQTELSGVFNWVLEGLERLVKSRKFTECLESDVLIEEYKTDSDSVASYTEEYQCQISNEKISLEDLYQEYRRFCINDGVIALAKKRMADRLRRLGFKSKRENRGVVFFMSQGNNRYIAKSKPFKVGISVNDLCICEGRCTCPPEKKYFLTDDRSLISPVTDYLNNNLKKNY